nr:AAA family ATPase [Desulfotruncus arcticus]
MDVLKIALTGRMRSGKDTVAQYLADIHNFQSFAFADGIRKVCALAFPGMLTQGRKPRKLYQGLGQDLRKYDPEVWIKYTFNEIEAARNKSVIITDMRQPNEYRALRNKGFSIVRVNASHATRLERMRAVGDEFEPADLDHETERHINTFVTDFELWNEGSVEELEIQAEQMLEFLQRRGTPWVA